MRWAGLILTLTLTGCVPWTVRPLDHDKASAAGERFDATRFVDSVWDSKLLPALDRAAVDLQSLRLNTLQPGSHVVVKGSAKVLKATLTPPSGSLTLDLLPADGKPDALLQTGPEIRGSSLRDATSVTAFSQFVNQIDFANAGAELNRRAARTLPPRSELAKASGRTIAFTGTFTALAGALPEIVPARFAWLGEPK